VGVYVQKQLKLILEGYEKENSGFGNLFERAGIDVQNLNLPEQGAAAEEENMENEGEIASEEALRKFNVCIAIFSKFKISTPYSLASKMLTGEDSDTVIYSSDKRKLFQLLTTQIPWIHYGCQNEDEDFKFSFRNTLEANIFLEKNKVTPEEQVDMICEFIRLYGKEYQKNKYIDEELKKGLRQLLRMVGPNTNYPDYAKDGKEKDVYREILRELNRMIEELKNLRETYGVPDEDGSLVILEVSFMREYYGWKWDEVSGYNDTYRESGDKRWSVLLDYYSPKNYLERLGNLKRAIDIAVEKLKEIERRLINCNNFRDRRNLIDRRNSLTNEMVLCNLVAQEIHGQYKECCEELSTEVNKEWQELRFTLPYRDVFERMQEVIDSNPTNGYYYNTIMKAFLKEYNRSNIPKRSQMECLSEINLLIDPIDTGEIPNITNRGYGEYDELDKHILEIRQLASDYKVTIDDLDHKKCNFEDFYQMYDTMQEVNNPSAILFVCRQELSAENILKQHEALLPEQRKICTKVADFMQRDENMRCIERKPAAMAMLIRVVWMESSGFPLSNLKEANLPAMPVDKWKNLMSLCEQYEEIAKEAKKPSIMLIYALSVLQVTGSYGKCMAVLKRIGDKNFYSSYRMRVPYIYCNEQKEPQLYSGEIQKIDGNRGEILLHVSEKNVMAKFDLRNLTSKLMKNPPAIHTVLNGLELGLGYTGFSLYMEEGRKAKAGV
jgi:hypothetical protein